MKCEFCGYDNSDNNRNFEKYGGHYGIHLYPHYRMNLCDRCVDKINSYHNDKDIDEYWEDDDAIKCGFEPFPRHKDMPIYYVCCYNDIEYIKIHLKKLWDIENEYYESSEQRKESLKCRGEHALDIIMYSIEEMRKKYENRTV